MLDHMHSMRVALIVAWLGGVSAADPVATPAPTSHVTSELPAAAVAKVTGCWRHDNEQWTFRPAGKHGLEVVREIGDVGYAERVRIPRAVNYDPTVETYGFGAAGRIHGLVMMFQIDGATLKASVYSSHDGKSYFYTGNTWTLRRC
jgi:hypothetical protein